MNLQEEQQKQAQQVTRKLLLPLPSGVRREKARKPTDQEKKFSVYEELQFARWDKRTYGKRQKKAAEAANAPDAKPAKVAGDEWSSPWVPLICFVYHSRYFRHCSVKFSQKKEFTVLEIFFPAY